MSDLDDGYDEVLEAKTIDDDTKECMRLLKIKYPDRVAREESPEYKAIKLTLELVTGKVHAMIVLEKYI